MLSPGSAKPGDYFKGMTFFVQSLGRDPDDVDDDIRIIELHGGQVTHDLATKAKIIAIVDVVLDHQHQGQRDLTVTVEQDLPLPSPTSSSWTAEDLVYLSKTKPKRITVLQTHWLWQCIRTNRLLGGNEDSLEGKWGGWQVTAKVRPSVVCAIKAAENDAASKSMLTNDTPTDTDQAAQAASEFEAITTPTTIPCPRASLLSNRDEPVKLSLVDGQVSDKGILCSQEEVIPNPGETALSAKSSLIDDQQEQAGRPDNTVQASPIDIPEGQHESDELQALCRTPAQALGIGPLSTTSQDDILDVSENLWASAKQFFSGLTNTEIQQSIHECDGQSADVALVSQSQSPSTTDIDISQVSRSVCTDGDAQSPSKPAALASETEQHHCTSQDSTGISHISEAIHEYSAVMLRDQTRPTSESARQVTDITITPSHHNDASQDEESHAHSLSTPVLGCNEGMPGLAHQDAPSKISGAAKPKQARPRLPVDDANLGGVSVGRVEAAKKLHYRAHSSTYAVPETPCERCTFLGLDCFHERLSHALRTRCAHCKAMKVGCPSVTAAQSGKRPFPVVEKGRVREESKKRKFLGRPERAATGQFLKQNTVTAPKVIKKARGVVRGGLKPPAVSTPSIQRSAPAPAQPQRPASTPHVTAAAVSKPSANSSASVPFHRTTGPSVIPPSTASHPSVKPIFVGPRHPLSFHVLPRNDALLTIIIKNCGGEIDVLESAMYIISPGDVDCEVELTAPRHECSKIVSAKWVWACAQAARLLDPSTYELGAHRKGQASKHALR